MSALPARDRAPLSSTVRHPVVAILACLGAAALANRAVPHMHEVIHGVEAFAAAVAVWLVASLTTRLQRREAELREVEERRVRAERIAALTTLAAGAAHELATPLGTIKMVARELERTAEARADQAAVEDVQLIRSEVERCRSVLDRLSTEGGELAGEMPTLVSGRDLGAQAVERLRPDQQARVQVRVEPPALRVRVPPQGAVQVLAGVIQNALDADPDGRAISFVLSERPGFYEFLVADHGRGMSEEVLARAREPFFTTKTDEEAAETGGMGLGLFLASSFVERLGGDLTIESAPGEGTRVLVSLPADGGPPEAR